METHLSPCNNHTDFTLHSAFEKINALLDVVNELSKCGDLPPLVMPGKLSDLSNIIIALDNRIRLLYPLYGVKESVAKNYGTRPDGSLKGLGYFGEIFSQTGNIMTEVSVEIGGIEMPSLVPTLSDDEIKLILRDDPEEEYTPQMLDKIKAYADERIDKGLNPFAQDGEQTFKRDWMITLTSSLVNLKIWLCIMYNVVNQFLECFCKKCPKYNIGAEFYIGSSWTSWLIEKYNNTTNFPPLHPTFAACIFAIQASGVTRATIYVGEGTYTEHINFNPIGIVSVNVMCAKDTVTLTGGVGGNESKVFKYFKLREYHYWSGSFCECDIEISTPDGTQSSKDSLPIYVKNCYCCKITLATGNGASGGTDSDGYGEDGGSSGAVTLVAYDSNATIEIGSGGDGGNGNSNRSGGDAGSTGYLTLTCDNSTVVFSIGNGGNGGNSSYGGGDGGNIRYCTMSSYSSEITGTIGNAGNAGDCSGIAGYVDVISLHLSDSIVDVSIGNTGNGGNGGNNTGGAVNSPGGEGKSGGLFKGFTLRERYGYETTYNTISLLFGNTGNGGNGGYGASVADPETDDWGGAGGNAANGGNFAGGLIVGTLWSGVISLGTAGKGGNGGNQGTPYISEDGRYWQTGGTGGSGGNGGNITIPATATGLVIHPMSGGSRGYGGYGYEPGPDGDNGQNGTITYI